MPTTAERLGVVENKVENLEEKVDELKVEVKDGYQDIKEQLKTMYDASCTQHAELAKKITNLEKIRDKITWMVAGAVGIFGILLGHLDKFIAFLH
jgi:uncharacterized coiled-coil DUF342 family protein